MESVTTGYQSPTIGDVSVDNPVRKVSQAHPDRRVSSLVDGFEGLAFRSPFSDSRLRTRRRVSQTSSISMSPSPCSEESLKTSSVYRGALKTPSPANICPHSGIPAPAASKQDFVITSNPLAVARPKATPAMPRSPKVKIGPESQVRTDAVRGAFVSITARSAAGAGAGGGASPLASRATVVDRSRWTELGLESAGVISVSGKSDGSLQTAWEKGGTERPVSRIRRVFNKIIGKPSRQKIEEEREKYIQSNLQIHVLVLEQIEPTVAPLLDKDVIVSRMILVERLTTLGFDVKMRNRIDGTKAIKICIPPSSKAKSRSDMKEAEMIAATLIKLGAPTDVDWKKEKGIDPTKYKAWIKTSGSKKLKVAISALGLVALLAL